MRWIIYLLVLIVVFSSSVLGATQTISVVEKTEASQDTGKSLWEIVKSLWWVAVLIIIILGLLLWLVIWLINKIKDGEDVWFQIMKDKKELCKTHRDSYRIKAFFKFRENHPIRVYYEVNKKVHSQVVGYYRGHYLSHDGNMIILFNCTRKWLVFPRSDLIFLNTREKITVTRTQEKKIGHETKVVKIEEELKFPYNFYDFRANEVVIYANGLDKDYRTGFYYPVLKDQDGRVINMSLPVYESVKSVAIEGYLFDQTDDFVKVAKKSIDLNPTIRGVNKVADSSSAIETQNQAFRQGQ